MIIEHKILSTSFNKCFGAQKNRLIETVLSSTKNIYLVLMIFFF